MTAEKKRPRTALAPPQQAVLDEELSLSAKVSRRLAQNLATPERGAGVPGFDQDLISLRDQMSEARNEDIPALLNEMMRLAAVQQVDTPDDKGPPDPRKPYFGHLRLTEQVNARGGKKETVTRDVLIGKRSLVDRKAGVVIVDWRDAPVSRLYYRYDEGDDYEVQFGNEQREGMVDARRTVTFEDGELVRVRTPENTLLMKPDDDAGPRGWIALDRSETAELRGGAGVAHRAPDGPVVETKKGKGRRGRGKSRFGHDGPSHLRADKHLPEIAALIDPAQFDAMTTAGAGLCILQGGAGSGKTTVALHRLAFLSFSDPGTFRPDNMLFVVRQPALVKYVSRILPSLDVAEVKVKSYADFSADAARSVVKGRLRRIVAEAPAEVGRLKKHPGILVAMERQAQRRVEQARDLVSRQVAGKPGAADIERAVGARLDEEDRPLCLRLRMALGAIETADAPEDTKERARRAVTEVLEVAADLIGQWEELCTDRALLAPVQEPGRPGAPALTGPELERALAWTGEQVDEIDDDGIDPAQKRSVDGIEDAPSMAQRFDPHDCALLLNLCLVRYGALTAPHRKKPLRFSHVAVDEAQDLSAVELRPLLACTDPLHSMTLAGDIVQKVVFDNGFATWAELCEQLGVAAQHIEPLRLTYRSTKQITAFAHDALGPLAPAEAPRAVRDGKPVEVFTFDEPGEELAFLAENLRAVMAREPRASVAVLCRYPERARFFYKMLRDADVPRLRLVLADEFPFTPGVDVTFVENAKGLEYDYVVLPDLTREMYPDQAAARHLLHIGATRAAFQLWGTCAAQPSPLLSSGQTRG